ncbi:helix-turn-helix transcriptional regulator [Lentzea sp. NPDC003310]|uniref:helix-turn-helix domain-containing protein n=1 Tax=Lentzea sp. NPDC003310 TaxID=3154447 RepID=UPI0033A22EE8
MSDFDVVAQKISGLVHDLRRAHRTDGEPSFDVMARRAGYSKATLHRVLKGRDLPKWDVLHAFLTACRVAEDEMSPWKARWIEIKNLIDPIPASTTTGVPGVTADDSCDRCGLRIGNPDVHAAWHEQFVPRTDTARRALTSVPA